MRKRLWVNSDKYIHYHVLFVYVVLAHAYLAQGISILACLDTCVHARTLAPKTPLIPVKLFNLGLHKDSTIARP